MTEKQRLAGRRNWQKARLMGYTPDPFVLTDEETQIALELLAAKNRLLEHWDENTAILMGHPLKPYKCQVCGRRVGKKHEYRREIFCYTHYKMFNNAELEESDSAGLY